MAAAFVTSAHFRRMAARFSRLIERDDDDDDDDRSGDRSGDSDDSDDSDEVVLFDTRNRMEPVLRARSAESVLASPSRPSLPSLPSLPPLPPLPSHESPDSSSSESVDDESPLPRARPSDWDAMPFFAGAGVRPTRFQQRHAVWVNPMRAAHEDARVFLRPRAGAGDRGRGGGAPSAPSAPQLVGVGAVPFMQDPRFGHLFAVLAFDNRLRRWTEFGGRVRPREDVARAAAREVWEESAGCLEPCGVLAGPTEPPRPSVFPVRGFSRLADRLRAGAFRKLFVARWWDAASERWFEYRLFLFQVPWDPGVEARFAHTRQGLLRWSAAASESESDERASTTTSATTSTTFTDVDVAIRRGSHPAQQHVRGDSQSVTRTLKWEFLEKTHLKLWSVPAFTKHLIHGASDGPTDPCGDEDRNRNRDDDDDDDDDDNDDDDDHEVRVLDASQTCLIRALWTLSEHELGVTDD